MNINSEKYDLYLQISNDWPLDDWSITKECFDKIVEILPFKSTILEIGSGNSTRILSKFYNMISIESDMNWMNKYNSEYIYIPVKKFNSETFGETKWLDIDILKTSIQNKKYDLLIVDAGGDRVGIYDNLNIFKTNIPIIFDDTMNEEYLKCANMVSNLLNKTCTTYKCAVNKFVVNWFDGKKYSLIM
jgi:spore coat polysaccharide biosynthesis predicted glycosyltransferase SpsG